MSKVLIGQHFIYDIILRRPPFTRPRLRIEFETKARQRYIHFSRPFESETKKNLGNLFIANSDPTSKVGGEKDLDQQDIQKTQNRPRDL